MVMKAHLAKYPKMQPEDCAKLIYQSEFAGEHMISSRERSLEWIKQELAETAPYPGEVYEDIGSGIARLHLGAAKHRGMTPEEINERFVSSAKSACGSREGQMEKLALLEELCREGCTSFSMDDLQIFLEGYMAEGCPSLHHSQIYRNEYDPHYRVVKRES